MKKIILTALSLLNVLFLSCAFGAGSFVVRHIDVHGLQRISPETVYSYLPIKKGEQLRPSQTSEVIDALYSTGFFDHISLGREGNTLVINLTERPTIGRLKISGNSFIPTDKLTTVMKNLDIAEGRVYNQAVLERIKQSLLSQYYLLGRYNARVDITTTELDRNRLIVNIKISEGLVAKIRGINIIGAHSFKNSELLKQLTISTPGMFTFFTQTDRYSQDKLDSSIANLRNFYLDRGFLKVVVKSTQVSITPDRKSVFVTLVIDEGALYTVQGFSLSGTFVVPQADLQKLITIKTGDHFSRQAVIDSEKAMNDALGDKGYAYATINFSPKIDETHKTVFLAFNVVPGKRVYVRHIFFSDNAKTNDQVLRRQMLQMEGAVISTSKVEESKHNLDMLPYIKDVQETVVPVPEQKNLVDVNYKVTEQSAAELTGRIGYSQVEHWLVGAGINQKNFLGTGKTVGLDFQRSRFEKYLGLNYTDPFYTPDGISRTVTASISSYNPGDANTSSSYTTNEYDGTVVYGIPVGQEKNVSNRIQVGYGYQNTLLKLSPVPTNISQEVSQFVQQHGRRYQQLDLILGVSRDSRDKAIFPTRGARQALGLNLFLPLQRQSLTYYTLNYNAAWYQPLFSHFILTTRGTLGYGNSLHKVQDYPFFKNFYAGGIDSVRGYEGNTLGPKDSNLQPTGGNFLADAGIGIILPNFFSDSLRTTLFVDAGNVYQTYDNRALGGSASGPLRYSSGVQVEWLSFLGLIDLSLAKAINPQHSVDRNLQDQTEIFQFSLGANFG